MSGSQGYLILYNIGKRANFGTLIRSAAAMGIQDIFVVGSEKLRTFGNQNTTSKCRFHYWDRLDELQKFLHGRGVEIVGVEIDQQAELLGSCKWPEKPVAFMLGNEGTGMNDKQKAICDRFVIIEHFGSATASLNVAVAGAIVFHHWAVAKNAGIAMRSGQKYVVNDLIDTIGDNLSQPNRERSKHRHAPLDLADVDYDLDLDFDRSGEPDVR